MGDQVTYISLLTAAIEINNVIGHALEETPLRMKEPLPRPSCDGKESLKHGASKQNKPFMLFHGAVLYTSAATDFCGDK